MYATYTKNKTKYQDSDTERVFIQDKLHGTDKIAGKIHGSHSRSYANGKCLFWYSLVLTW